MDKQAAIPLREFTVAMRHPSAGFAVRAARFPEDFAAIHRLVADNWCATGPRTSLHPGDVYWRAYRKPDDWYVFLDDCGVPVVAVQHDSRLHACDLICRPGLAGTEAETTALAWVEEQEQRVGGRSLTVGCFDGDELRYALLTRLGYKSTPSCYVHFLHSLDVDTAPAPLATGYTLRSFAGMKEVTQRIEAARQAFGSTSLTPAVYQRMLAGPGYDRELDIVAVAADGSIAAFAIGWYDPQTRVGEFEPVGCIETQRKRGLAKAILLEGLRRLRLRGATQAVVYAQHDNQAAGACYQSIGFVAVGHDRDYTKTFNIAAPE